MSFEPIIFLALATMLVIAAGAVVTLRNPVHAAMSLVLTFFTSAMLWILLRAAAAARSWLSSANCSMRSREMSHFSAIISAPRNCETSWSP